MTLCAEAFVKVDIGINYEIGFLANGFTQFIGPAATLEGGVEGYAAIPFAQAGVRGVITLLEEKFGVNGSATLDLVNDGQCGKTWVTRETNTSGTYEAVYRRLTATQVEKSKRRFFEPAPAMGSAEAEISSSESIRIDAKRDWIAAMTVDEITRTRGPAAEVTSHATLELQQLTRTTAADDEWSFVAAPAPERVDLARAAIAVLSPEEARQQLHAELLALDAASQGRSTLVHRLRDLLGAHATLPAVLLELIRTEQPGERTRADVFLALELAGTASAQAALRSVLADESWPPADALRADASLSWEIVALLDDDEPAVRSAAAQSLGSLGTSEVADTLVLHLRQETNSVVRGAIAAALVSWDHPSLAATESVQVAIRQERDENTRYEMARFLARNLAAFPDNRVVLQDLLHSEPSRRIREHVTEVLVTVK